MDPTRLAYHNGNAQAELRENGRRIAALFGNRPEFPTIPAIAKNARGPAKEVANLRQIQALANVLAFTVTVLEKIGPEIIADAANEVADDLLAKSAAEAQQASAEPAPEPEPEPETVGVEEIPEGYVEFIALEQFRLGDQVFEPGDIFHADPDQVSDALGIGEIMTVDQAADPNPDTPEGEAARGGIELSEIGDPNPDKPEFGELPGSQFPGQEGQTPDGPDLGEAVITEPATEPEAKPAPEKTKKKK